tara:strand:- start:153 stop:497 length:345 start_codon:yes stop_codon:yes gene_type:complete
MKILLIEDLDLFAAYLTSMFLGEHEVSRARSAAEAISIAREGDFDLFLVDYDLEGDKGTDFVEWLRGEAAKSAPVIAISARSVGNEKLEKAGANARCAKLEIARIQQVIASLCD